jgi:hypothetical protein
VFYPQLAQVAAAPDDESTRGAVCGSSEGGTALAINAGEPPFAEGQEQIC